jgi:hypothetical protein
VATISYAFDRDDEMAGPFLDPLNPQSLFSTVLLRLVTQVLSDATYVARLEAHYYQVKGITAAPTPTVQRLLTRKTKPPTAHKPRRKKPKRRKR